MVDDIALAQQNERLLGLLSRFLTFRPRAVSPEMLQELQSTSGMSASEAYGMLLATLCGLEIADNPKDRALYRRVFPKMVHQLEARAFRQNPYLLAIRFPCRREGSWEMRMERYQPCEAFVCDDLELLPDGTLIPQIGFFQEAFDYPAVLENGREWMTVTPNEIATMKPAIAAAHGKVLTYGLGLGYFAFMASQKESVCSVTVVERDPAVLHLFEQYIRPQFPKPDKLQLVQADAFDYARRRMGQEGFDLVFTDLWHDPGDGLALYRRMKACERFSPQSHYMYWIEKTLLAYLTKA